ncbi:MAG TPA: hypothetical protein VMZ91_12955 [Candidatus Paceibacterota bacterium]|nr:hypothetical protein [Candidatus Paceibacterota bacterium]
MGTAKITEEKTGNVIEYYIDDRLKNSLDKKVIPSLHEKDKDFVVCLDGREGSGKSTFALQLGKYIDKTLNLSRIVFTPDAFREAVLNAKKGQCIIYDEAFTGFSSRASLSPINKVLVSLAMQMRQKNLCIIVVLPTIFLLDRYMAIFRTRALIHVFELHGRRGYFKLYNYRLKKLLILLGAKTMSYNSKYVKSNFRGRFYGKFALGDERLEKKYRKMKEEALANSEKTSMSSAQVRYKEQRDLILYLLRKNTKLTYQELANLIADYDIMLSFQQIAKICAKFGDVASTKDKINDENGKKKGKKKDKSDLPKEIEEKDENIDKLDKELIESDEKEEDTEDFE